MSGKQFQQCGLSLASLVTLVLLLFMPADCQITTPEHKSKEKSESHPTTDNARWQYMLDGLAREVRSLPQEETRPFLMAEVADAYWELDQARSRELFMTSLEAALSLKSDTNAASQAVHHVFKLAAKRDASLARKMMEKLLESPAENDWATAESTSVALDLLDADPARAAQLAEANAPAGPSLDTAWFILQLSGRDPAAADQVYRAYLSRFAPNTGFGLDRLLWLVGYPFGYAEALGGSLNPAQMVGFNGLRISGPTPKPALAQAFLDVALRASQDALRRASEAEPQQTEALNGLVLFTTSYLLPEVQRYRPQTLPQWSLLAQQALSGTTVTQKEIVARRLQEIAGSRVTLGQHDSAESYATGLAEELLARAEKSSSGCERDTKFAQAALSIGYAKDFTRAFSVSERIENDSLQDSVRQFLYYDMSSAALTRGDSGSLNDAQKYIERIVSPEQRALLYIKIAKAALRHQDRQLAAESLVETMRLAQTVSEPAAHTSILLASAAGFAEFDTYEGYQALKEAVKIVNSTQSPNVEDFHVLRKVNLACRAGEDTWYGDSDRAERFSLFETFATLASGDVDGTSSLARDLNDSSIRIRALISIAKAMIKKTRSISPASSSHG